MHISDWSSDVCSSERAKGRGGLGLIPRRLSTYGDLWNGPFEWPDVKQRIMEYHQPYHLALGDSLRMARQRFGCAILLDIHSMPPLTGQGGLPSAKIVLEIGRAHV